MDTLDRRLRREPPTLRPPQRCGDRLELRGRGDDLEQALALRAGLDALREELDARRADVVVRGDEPEVRGGEVVRVLHGDAPVPRRTEDDPRQENSGTTSASHESKMQVQWIRLTTHAFNHTLCKGDLGVFVG